MIRFRAQHLAEFAIIGALVLGLSVLSLFFFGDKLIAIFSNMPGISMFTGSRTAYAGSTGLPTPVEPADPVSPVTKSELEKLLAALNDNSDLFVDMMGGEGLDLFSSILNEFLTKLEEYLLSQNIPNYIVEEFLNLNKEFRGNCQSFINLDGASSSQEALARRLNFILSFESLLSQNYSEKGDKVKNYLSQKDSDLGKLLGLYVDSIRNMADDLTYSIKTADLQNLVDNANFNAKYDPNNSVTFEDGDTKFVTNPANNSITVYIDQISYQLSQTTTANLSNFPPEVRNELTGNGKVSYELAERSKYCVIDHNTGEIKIVTLTTDLDPYGNPISHGNPIYITSTAAKGKIDITGKTNAEVVNTLKNNLNNLSTVADQLNSSFESYISVYSEKNYDYNEILPKEYNGTAICQSLGISPSGGACNLDTLKK